MWYYPGRFSVVYTTTVYKTELEIFQKPLKYEPLPKYVHLIQDTLTGCAQSDCLREVPLQKFIQLTHTSALK